MTITLPAHETRRGDAWILRLEYPGATGLDEWTWRCQWRLDPADDDVIAEATVDLSLAASDSVITITVPGTVTAELPPATTVHFDVERSTSPEDAYTVVAGVERIGQDVTR